MKKRLFYIFSILLLLLTFNVFYFIGKSNYKQKNIDNINTNITEEDLLETARLQLHSLHQDYNDFENRKYNGIKILCNNDKKILYSIDLEKYDSSPNENPELINDYRIIYIGLEKKLGYYSEDYFASEELLNKYPLDKENYCNE